MHGDRIVDRQHTPSRSARRAPRPSWSLHRLTIVSDSHGRDPSTDAEPPQTSQTRRPRCTTAAPAEFRILVEVGSERRPHRFELPSASPLIVGAIGHLRIRANGGDRSPDMRRPTPCLPGPARIRLGLPRPPRIEVVDRHVRAEVGGLVVADTCFPIRFSETSHLPTYYVNPNDVELKLLQAVPGGTYCEWKGEAAYFDVVVSMGGSNVPPGGTRNRPATSPTSTPSPSTRHSWRASSMASESSPSPAVLRRLDHKDVIGLFKGEPGTNFW